MSSLISFCRFKRSSSTDSFPCTLSTGHGSKEFAATKVKQIANVELNMELVRRFLWVARIAKNIVLFQTVSVDPRGLRLEWGTGCNF